MRDAGSPPCKIVQRFDDPTLHDQWPSFHQRWTVTSGAGDLDEFFALLVPTPGGLRNAGVILFRPFVDPDLRSTVHAQPNFDNTISTRQKVLYETTHAYYAWNEDCTREMMQAAISVARTYKASILASSMPVENVEHTLSFQATCVGSKVNLKEDVERCLRLIKKQQRTPCPMEIDSKLAKKIWIERLRLTRFFHIDLSDAEPVPRET